MFTSDLSHVPSEILKMVSLTDQVYRDVGSIYGLVLRQIVVRFSELENQETTTGNLRKLQICAYLFLCFRFISGVLINFQFLFFKASNNSIDDRQISIRFLVFL